MVFMNAKKRNKSIVVFIVAMLSVGLLLSVSLYWQGGSANYSTSTTGSTVAPNSTVGKALADFQEGGTLMQQGKTADAQKKFTSAKKGFEEALKTDPKNYQVLGDLATSYYYTGEVDKAIETVKKALEISPNFAPARLNYGIYLAYGKNNPIEAVNELKKIQKSDSNYNQAQQLITEINQMKPTLPPQNSGTTVQPQN